MTEQEPLLRDNLLYLGDNGRVFCGACAPESTRYTCIDRGGEEVVEIIPEEARHVEHEEGITTACEICGRKA
ncbi:hypothetical protein [Halofilum ochraceum]|uniref:hypothetical protein n=1 Tax=Halofilum ochraceum TaxID=1611323 RepID=UPI0008D9B558|nr:hypothetical protein [Halofilum ochraceum]